MIIIVGIPLELICKEIAEELKIIQFHNILAFLPPKQRFTLNDVSI